MAFSMEEPRFAVDINVGALAKWLRALGCDAVLFRGPDDEGLVRLALRERRAILTRDTQLMRRRQVAAGRLRALLIRGDDWREQLRQVLAAFNLRSSSQPFSRCLECNLPLQPRPREEVQGLVPPYVFSTQEEFQQCPGCRRLYWQGTHWQRMRKELEGI